MLREAEQSDRTNLDVCRSHQISEQTFHRWKREFGMLEVDQAKHRKDLKRGNERLKRMLADEMSGKELLPEALEKCCEPRSYAAGHSVAGGSGSLYRPRGVSPLRLAPQHLAVSGP